MAGSDGNLKVSSRSVPATAKRGMPRRVFVGSKGFVESRAFKSDGGWLAGSQALDSTYPTGATLAGQPLTFACWVNQVSGGTSGFMLLLYDGTATFSAPYDSAVGGWQWLSVTYTPTLASSELIASFTIEGTAGDTYFIGNPCLVAGTLAANQIIRPVREVFVPFSYYNLATYDGSGSDHQLPTTATGKVSIRFGFALIARGTVPLVPT